MERVVGTIAAFEHPAQIDMSALSADSKSMRFPLVDGIRYWVHFNKIPTYPIFHLLRGGLYLDAVVGRTS